MAETADLTFLLLAGAAVIAMVIGGISLRARRRRRLFRQPLPEAWLRIIRDNVTLVRLLPDDLRRELHGRINLFLDEKDFEGCGGLAVTDEIRVTIAAFAGILLLNKDFDCYPGLNTVLVYPSAFIARGGQTAPGIYDEEAAVHLGESWQRGSVILAWDQVVYDGRRPGHGQNVVLHEFAHQLDQQKGFSNGVPMLSSREEADRFTAVVNREFAQLREETEHGIADVIDEYGAVNPAEFFAVSTESFFTAPEPLRRSHRELYDCLSEFYRLDPVAWHPHRKK